MKNILIFTFILCKLLLPSQTFQWALQEHYSDYNQGENVNTDKWGDVYISGRFSYAYVQSGNPRGAFISKYNSSGNLLWTDTIANVRVIKSVVDSMGNTYATGYFNSGSATFGSYTLYGSGYGGFTVKYNSAGQCVWAKSILGFGIALHPGGGCFVVGLYNSLVSRLDNNGNIIWTTAVNLKNPNGLGLCSSYSVASDKNGNAYIAGQFKDTVIMPNQDTLIYNGPYNNNLVAKYDSSGNFAWVKTDATPSYGFEPQFPFYIAVDSSSNPIVTGCFSGTLSMGQNIYAGSYYYTYGIIAQYANTGNLLWSKSISGTGNNLPYNIIIDDSQNFFITGTFDGTTNFGNGVTGTAQGGAFVLKFDKNANTQWIAYSTQTVGGGGATGYGICSDDNNNLYMVGAFSGSNVVFGSTTLSTSISYYSDIFLTKIKDMQVNTGLNSNNAFKNDNLFSVYPNPTTGLL